MGLSNSNGAAVHGVILCVLAAANWAISVIAQKPALAHASARQVTTGGGTRREPQDTEPR
ncbi:hypothetical protein [Nocardia sp. IFM 10818]